MHSVLCSVFSVCVTPYSLDILLALGLTKSTFAQWLYNHWIVERFNVDSLFTRWLYNL